MSKEINTVKALMEDKDLVKYVTEDLDDFADDTAVTYEVWAIGYDEHGAITGMDMYITESEDPDVAIEKAKALTLADIIHQASEEDDGTEPADNVAYISVEVETVIDNEEDGTMNVGTIYKRTMLLAEECGEEGPPEDEYSEVVPVTSKEYKLLEDGSLEIDCEILKNFNKNDTVQIWFTDEDNKAILTYKIISKTTANKYICEFVY